MLLPQISAQPVSTNITNQSSKMSLVMSGKAFQVLSSSLYSHKIRAIIRELSTNAWDSHQDAGRADTPFDIQLPTDLSPIFRIRDYGTGMDEETIFGTYNVLFASTKTQTNEAVGCLGLGSKSPFAYTSAVTVSSYQNGHKSIYNSIMDSDGIPSMVKVLEMATDAPDGLEIQFAVEKKDFNDFIRESKYVFLTFLQGAEPNFLNCNLTIKDIKKDLVKVTDGLYFADTYNINHNSGTYVIQGNVAYPLNRYMIPEAARNALSHINSRHIPFIVVPIGTVDFQPSREGLSEQQDNYDKITPYLLKIEEDITETFREQLADITTLYDACEYVSKQSHGKIADHLVSDYYFNKIMKEKGFALNKIKPGWTTKDFDENLLEVLGIASVGGNGGYNNVMFKTKNIPTEGPQQLVNEEVQRYTGFPITREVYKDPKPHTVHYMQYSDILATQEKVVFVEVDDAKRYKKKCAAHFKDTGKCRIVLKNSAEQPTLVSAMKQELPGFTWIKTSEMADVVTTRGASKNRVMRRWFQKLERHGYCSREHLQTLEGLGLDDEKPFLYIVVDGYGRSSEYSEYYSHYYGGASPFKKVYGIRDAFKELKDMQLVLIADCHLEKLSRHFPLAKSFKEKVKETIDANYTKESVQELLSTSHGKNIGYIKQIQNIECRVDMDESIDFFKEFTEVKSKCSINIIDKLGDDYCLKRHFDISSSDCYPVAGTVWESFVEKYPLLSNPPTVNYGASFCLKENITKLLKKETN